MSEPTVTLTDAAFQLAVTHHEQQVSVALTDRATGTTWRSPLLVLEIHDKTLRREDFVAQYRVDEVAASEDAIHVVVCAPGQQVAVSVWLRLEAGELVVSVPYPEVYERRPAHFRLFAVDLLPELMAVGAEGTLILPLGQGALCSPRGKPAVADRCMIFLEQERWEIGTTLPYVGAHGPGGGLLCLASQGASEAQFRVVTDGQGQGRVSMATVLRRHWPDPVYAGARELRYSRLAPAADLVAATADRVRRHVMEDWGKAPLKERAAASPELAYVLQSYSMKLFHGIENEGLEMQGHDKARPQSFFNLMTFAETVAGLARLRAAGLAKIHVQSVGWNARGHDGLYPARFPIEERLGGERGFRAMLREGQAMGYQMSVHDNFSMNLPYAPNYDPELIIQDVYGEPLVSGWWAGGLEYQSWGLALPHDRLEGHLQRLHDLGVRGLYYCDYMMRPLECNYHPRWRGSRHDHMRGQLRVLTAARDRFGAMATEYGILPAAAIADYISAGGGGRRGQPHWPIKQLQERTVPIWELVFSGLTLSEGCGLTWPDLMRRTLFGKQPRDEWTIRPARTPVLDDARIAQLAAHYELSVNRFGHLRTERIVSWQAPADQVQVTRFSDGTEVTADFGRRELLVNGQLVPCPAVLKA
jgi:hypothetical protein